MDVLKLKMPPKNGKEKQGSKGNGTTKKSNASPSTSPKTGKNKQGSKGSSSSSPTKKSSPSSGKQGSKGVTKKSRTSPSKGKTKGKQSLCPICNDPLQSSDKKYAVLCETDACKFNMCHSCTTQLLSTSNQGLQEGSDGNQYSIELQCPSCRGAFEVGLDYVLALRDHELQELLKDKPDMELNARDLRRKHDVSDDKLMFQNKARDLYNTAKAKQSPSKKGKSKAKDKANSNGNSKEGVKLNKSVSNETEDPTDVDDISLAQSMNANPNANSPENNKRLKNKIEYVDSMLFQGLGECMSDAEKKFVLQLMTSGSTAKLVMAAELFEKIIAMNAIPREISPERPSSPFSILTRRNSTDQTPQDLGSRSFESENYTPSYRVRRERPKSATSAASAATLPSTLENSQTLFQMEASQRSQWGSMYPLPFRMPRAFVLDLDFDPYDRARSPIRFADDEETFSFLKDIQYNKLSYDDRCTIVKDAFSYLSVSLWRNVVKRDCSNFLGAENILLGLEPNAEERPGPDEIVPWRRVIVSYVHRSISRSSGLKVGDVVTHLDGEVFDGNVEKLKFMLAAKTNETSSGQSNPQVEIVVNADISVAEVLRLRSFMARNQPYE